MHISMIELILGVMACFDYLGFATFLYKGGFKGPTLKRFHVLKKKKKYAIIIHQSLRNATIALIISSVIFLRKTKIL